MKTNNYFFTSLVSMTALFLMMTISGCKSGKEVPAVQAPPADVSEKLIEVYCSGPEFQSDAKVFRANSIGESADQATAKKKALSNAKADLAGFMETTLKSVFDNYVKDSEMNNITETLERYEGLSREVVNQQLNGVKVICEKQTVTKNNTYKTYIAIELSGNQVFSGLNERLSGDDQLFIDYNYEKFKQTFEQEMENMKK